MKITCTIADGKVVIGEPKTDRSNRELPIRDPMYSALRQAVQQREKREAGDKFRDTGRVFVDALAIS